MASNLVPNYSGYWRGLQERAVEARRLIGLGKKLPLRRLTVVATTACNLRCRFCDVVEPNNPQTLPKENALSVIQEAVLLGVQLVHFTGGECTMAPWLLEGISRVQSLGADAAMTTNGAVDPFLAKEIVGAGIKKIHVSLHISSRSEADMPNIQKTLRFVEALSLLRLSKPFMFYINCVFNRNNLHLLPQHVEWLHSRLNISGVYAIAVKNRPDLALSLEDVRCYHKDILPKVKDVLSKHYIDPENSDTYRSLAPIFGGEDGDWQAYADGIYPHALRYPCYTILQEAVVDPQGKIYDCYLSYCDKAPSIGNTSHKSLEDIVMATKNLERILGNTPLFPQCKTGCATGFGEFNRLVHEALHLA